MSQQRMTFAEWHAEAVRRFGEDMMKWRFICPSCGHVQTIEDFRPYKDQGATPDSARQECIGRYQGAAGAFDARKFKPCDYALYGLLHLEHVEVVQESGHVSKAFHFAEAAS